jgi:e3 binding domain
VALARAADEELLMAQKTTKSQRSGGRRGQNASSRNGKGSAQSGGDKRPALEAMRQDTDADREYRQYVRREEQDRAGPPDVLLDVPELKVDLIHFELDDLDAHVAVKAQVLNLVKLTVGVDVHLSRVKLDIKGVEAELVMKAHLEHVAALVDRLMTSLDRNPELVDGLSRAVSEIGQGAGEAVDETGDAAKDVGKGAEGALKDVGQGAGQAVGDVGQGAGQAVGDVGQGAGQAAGNLDQLVGGVGQTVGQAGQGAGQALGGLGQGAGEGGQGGQALGGPGEGAGQALGQPGGNAQPQPDGQGQAGRPGAVAKQVAKMVAREIGHAASDEAKDLGLAATRKVRELGERREHRRAEKHNATEAAVRLADELGIDVADLEGTGSDGRVTVNDVRKAHEA